MLKPCTAPEGTPPEEAARLAALRRYQILDTPPCPHCDRLAALTARLFAAPYAGIGFVDADRVWYKSCFGISLEVLTRATSLCDPVVSLNGVFVLEDAALDARYRDIPFVLGPPHLRFYAGAPLRTPDGFCIGTLCLADLTPHTFPTEARNLLTILAAVVMREVELHHALAQMKIDGPEGPRLSLLSRRLRKAYNHLEAWVGQRTAALERVNKALEHEVVEHARAEMSLRTIRAELEEHIAQRTAALERANEDLRAQITERRAAERRLEESRQRYRSLFDQNRDAVYSFDRRGRFLSANAASEGLSGYSPRELRRMSFQQLIVPEYQARAVEMFEKALSGQAQHGEIAITRKDGRRVEISVSKMPILIAGEIVGVFGISRDITTRWELERERERLLREAMARAEHDSLTGLANHAAFHKRLNDALLHARQVASSLTVLLLDLDDFRFFNDTYGHVAGDDVLRRVAEALREVAGPGGSEAARYAGDEFAVLLPATDRAEAEAPTQALMAQLARLEYRPPGHDSAVPLSLSVGAARFPEDGATLREILSAADARLRRAKTGADEQAERLRTALARSVEGFSMLDALVTAVDNKDRYTRRHSEDVLAYSRLIAEALGLDEKTQRQLQTAALLHDVGKIGVPDAVLRKPGRLTDDEFAAIKQHPMMGAIIVGAVPGFEQTLDAIRHHHERWDGGGYPFGLRGEEIPFSARLMAVADAFSAMTTDRPYRKGMEAAQALSVLERGAGTQWDPECVRVFLRARGNP